VRGVNVICLAITPAVEAVRVEQRIVLEHLIAQRGPEFAFGARLTDDLLEAYASRAKGVAAINSTDCHTLRDR
jgi:hypothetical protein